MFGQKDKATQKYLLNITTCFISRFDRSHTGEAQFHVPYELQSEQILFFVLVQEHFGTTFI